MQKLPMVTLAAAAAVTMGAVFTAQGQQSGEYRMRDDAARWMAMNQEVIPASELLEAYVSNGLNPVGEVAHAVLDRDMERVQYLVIDSKRRPWFFFVEDGYVAFDAVDFVRGYGDLTMRIERTAEMPGPEEIDITLDEAEYRLASRIMESRLALAGEQFYEIEDMLVNRDTGEITHFVIGAVEDQLFAQDRRAVPASQVRFRDGEFRSRLTFAEIESRQPYDPSLL